jgi:shikimate dehydrogenase
MTQHHALIGQGIGHSLSPALWTATFEALGSDADYGTRDVQDDALGSVEAELRTRRLDAVHVTMPHKHWAYGVVDERDEASVRWTGVVNSIRAVDGRLIGANTDLLSASIVLGELPKRPRRALVIGAGATAASLIGALLLADVEVLVTNRTDERALELAARAPSSAVRAVPWDQRASAEVDLVVNTAPFGLRTETSPFDTWPSGATALYDLIYRHEPTALQLQATEAGALVSDGLAHLQGHIEATLAEWPDVPHAILKLTEIFTEVAGRAPARWDASGRF